MTVSGSFWAVLSQHLARKAKVCRVAIEPNSAGVTGNIFVLSLSFLGNPLAANGQSHRRTHEEGSNEAGGSDSERGGAARRPRRCSHGRSGSYAVAAGDGRCGQRLDSRAGVAGGHGRRREE